MPLHYELAQNYPNPFNPKTTIRFVLPQSEYVTLKIYNVLGKEVDKLIDDFRPAGEFKVEWDVSNVASGLYFYTLKAGNFEQTRKLIVQR